MADVTMVKIGKLPGRIVEVALNGDNTVAAAIAAAEIEDTTGYEIRVNGATGALTTALPSGSTVLLLKKIKGNTVSCKVGKLPGRIVEIALEDGASVEDALEVAEIEADGYEIRLNSAPASITDRVPNGSTLLLLKKIKGN